jgi:hypothetical protein
MMVGHTHDDVDQMFSRFSVRLKSYQKKIVSIQHFFLVLAHAYNPMPRCEFMYRCMDWKSLLDKFSSHQDGATLHGHTRPHQFHFLPTEDGTDVKMIWKRWARDIQWFPAIADSPNVCLLQRQCTFDDFAMVQPRVPEPEEVISVMKMFNISQKYVPVLEYVQQMEHLKGWFTAEHVECNYFKPMARDFKWGLTAFDLACTDPDEAARGDCGSERSVTREDIVTSDEDLVYQGKIHSQRPDRIRHKNNFVNVDDIQPNQFILVRGTRDNVEEIWLCKVFKINKDSRTLTVQWYGGKTIAGAQNPELAADQGSSSGGKKKKKNAVFYQDISVDTVLVSEPFSLTTTKAIPRHKLKLARQRLLTFEKFIEQENAANDTEIE